MPDLSDPGQQALWARIETAKRRLTWGLDRLHLPRPAPGEAHPQPLIFDFLAEDPGLAQRILTGHDRGVITIALAEADDARREAERVAMGEAYRTLLGHFRHEIGHYYWDLLVRDGPPGTLEAFREAFGDERADYAAALERHHAEGAPPGWEDGHISAYATMHPWEDWAETWAHALHMIDTLDTAAALGIVPAGEDGVPADPYLAEAAGPLVAAWQPLTAALNALARSMGQADLYPFRLSGPVVAKLGFVLGVMRQGAQRQ